MQKKVKEGISRKEFVKLVGTGAVVVAGTALVNPLTAQTNPSPAPKPPKPAPADLPKKWDLEADVVVLGAGAVGLPAAIRAAEAGASVIVVDSQLRHRWTCHHFRRKTSPSAAERAIRRNTASRMTRKPFSSDLTDWSVVEVSGMPDYRYNDRAVQRALADNSKRKPSSSFWRTAFLSRTKPRTIRAATRLGSRPNASITACGQKARGAESPAGAGGTGPLCAPSRTSARKAGRQVPSQLSHGYRSTANSRSKARSSVFKASYTPTILPGSD